MKIKMNGSLMLQNIELTWGYHYVFLIYLNFKANFL